MELEKFSVPNFRRPLHWVFKVRRSIRSANRHASRWDIPAHKMRSARTGTAVDRRELPRRARDRPLNSMPYADVSRALWTPGFASLSRLYSAPLSLMYLPSSILGIRQALYFTLTLDERKP